MHILNGSKHAFPMYSSEITSREMVAKIGFLIFIDEVAKCFYINDMQVRWGGDGRTAGEPVSLRKKE
jgi:hypothetical protein